MNVDRVNIACMYLLAFSLTGCAGLSITALEGKPGEIFSRLAKDKANGYVVYSPMVTFEVYDKEICAARTESGVCWGLRYVCAIGNQNVVPDYEKPYLVTVRSGFGKAGVEVSLEKGWLLSTIKDNSDNTALLEALFKLSAGGYKPAFSQDDVSSCELRGLYRYRHNGTKPEVCRFWPPSESGKKPNVDCADV